MSIGLRGAAGSSSRRHDPRPLHRCRLVKRENAAREERGRSFRAGEPRLQVAAPLTRSHLEHATPYLGYGQRRDAEVAIGLVLNPVGDSARELGLGGFADDARVEEVTRHKSTSRGGTTSRSRFKLAPTRGDRRRAAQIPPRRGGSSETCLDSSARKPRSARTARSQPLGEPANKLLILFQATHLIAGDTAISEPPPVICHRVFLRSLRHLSARQPHRKQARPPST
jgi:hypothetical protein